MFKVGDKVIWTSSAAGYTRTKMGNVVAVLPPGGHPTALVMEVAPFTIPRGAGTARGHESYLVSVAGRRELYWPVASLLQAMT